MNSQLWDGKTERRSQQIDLPMIIETTKDGVDVLAGLLGFISKVAHSIGHVNHPLLIDKISEALKHLENLNLSLGDLHAFSKSTSASGSDIDASNTP